MRLLHISATSIERGSGTGLPTSAQDWGGLWALCLGEGEMGGAAMGYIHPVLCGAVGLTSQEN